jgi:ATP-dependent Zn protease
MGALSAGGVKAECACGDQVVKKGLVARALRCKTQQKHVLDWPRYRGRPNPRHVFAIDLQGVSSMMFLFFPFLLLIPFAMMWMMRSGNGGGMGCCGMDHSGDSPQLRCANEHQ